MSKEKQKLVIPGGHKPPVTRRDFIKYGVIPFAGAVLAPNFLTQILMSSVAKADAICGGASGGGYIPFLVLIWLEARLFLVIS